MTQTPSVLVHGKFRYDLQPLGDFTQKEANQLKKELEKHLVTIYLTEIEVPPKKDIPAFFLLIILSQALSITIQYPEYKINYHHSTFNYLRTGKIYSLGYAL